MLKETVSQYARVFDSRCLYWTDDRDYNKMLVKHIEVECNTLLVSKGYLFLRDVYEKLGFEITKESCFAGWVFNEANNDNFVDLKIKDDAGSNIIIDFNVNNENIIDLIFN